MNIDWSKSHCGVMLCSFDKTIELMPEVKEIINSMRYNNLLELHEDEYVVDIKVHMLLKNQFPCIPNWHKDFMPRDENSKHCDIATGEKMYLWVSGTPETEWKNPCNIRKIITPLAIWTEFTQHDIHRGTKSEEATWRCFIRIIPKKFIHPNTKNVGCIRRHSQVYLDSNKFTW